MKKHIPFDCDIIFDITLFSTKFDGNIKEYTGLDEKIQQSIMNHPKFDIMVEEIITNISLIGIGSIVLGSVFLMTAVILFSIVTVVREK